MKAILISAVLLVSSSLFATTVATENQQRAIALVQAKYMFSSDADTARYDIFPQSGHDDLNVSVRRSSTGGACLIEVLFQADGTIVIGNADCPQEN